MNYGLIARRLRSDCRGLLNKTHQSTSDKIFSTPKSRIFLWSFAIHCLFRLWGLAIDPEDLEGHTHPPTLLRLELAIAAASVEIENDFPQLKDCFWETVRDGQGELEKGFVYCGVMPITEADLIGSHDRRVNEHCDALLVSSRKSLDASVKEIHIRFNRRGEENQFSGVTGFSPPPQPQNAAPSNAMPRPSTLPTAGTPLLLIGWQALRVFVYGLFNNSCRCLICVC